MDPGFFSKRNGLHFSFKKRNFFFSQFYDMDPHAKEKIKKGVAIFRSFTVSFLCQRQRIKTSGDNPVTALLFNNKNLRYLFTTFCYFKRRMENTFRVL